MLEEIEEVVGDRVFITEADRTKLTYIAQITKETLRHYTTIAMITRYIMKETYVDGFRIPKGTEIAVCSMVPVPQSERFRTTSFDFDDENQRI